MIVTLKKTLLVGLLCEQEKILSGFQDYGQIQFVGEHCGQKTEPLTAALEKKSEVDFCIEFLSRYRVKTKVSLLRSFDYVLRELDAAAAESLLADSEALSSAIAVVRGYEKRLAEIAAEEKNIEAETQKLQPWRELEVNLDQLCDTKRTAVYIGSVSGRDTQGFRQALSKLSGAAFWQAGSTQDNDCFLVAVVKDGESLSEWESVSKEFSFSPAELSDKTGRVREIQDDCTAKITALNAEREEIFAAAAESELLRYFENMSDLLSIYSELLGATAMSQDTVSCFVMEGWVPEKLQDETKRVIQSLTDSVVMEFYDVEETDTPPSLMQNPKPVSFFEKIVADFSAPDYRDVDPSMLIAVFYSIFFGIMLGDTGYGLLVALAGAFILFCTKAKQSTKKFMGIFFCGGISSMVMGVLFGSYFGTELFPPVLFAPLDETLLMMALCIGLGVAHLFSGYIAKAYRDIKEGRVAAAIFEQGFWMLFIIGLLLLLGSAILGGSLMGEIGKWVTIGSAAVIIISPAAKGKNIFKRIGGGLGTLYNITGFLSDALSYTRLFALCLSSGIIASVVNDLAMLPGGPSSIAGFVFMILILLVGHSINLALALLSAYVHTNRLQYVEFLGKFYEGNGETFTPLRRNTEYIKIISSRSSAA